jgi:hypothetical protein
MIGRVLRCGFWIPAAALLLAAGCGGKPTGELSGLVTFNGQPLALGTITFICQDGTVARGNIMDGAYHVEKVWVGPTKITVFAHPSPYLKEMLEKMQPPPPPALWKEYVPIPERYQDPDQSGLSYEVVRGKQTHDVSLTP